MPLYVLALLDSFFHLKMPSMVLLLCLGRVEHEIVFYVVVFSMVLLVWFMWFVS